MSFFEHFGEEIVNFNFWINRIRDRIMAVEKLKLNNGYEMPIYGLGTMFVSLSNMTTCKKKQSQDSVRRLRKKLVSKQ